jgi:hypothetical protein
MPLMCKPSKRPGSIVASESVLESSVNRYRRTIGFKETGRRQSKYLARISTGKRPCLQVMPTSRLSCAELRGRRYARDLTRFLAAQILAAGKSPFLHVKYENGARVVSKQLDSVYVPQYI